MLCCILKYTEYTLEEPGWCRDMCDNVFYIIIITPQPLLAEPETWTSSQLPPAHAQGWSRLSNQILVTSQIVIQTFTKMGKCPKSANNQNSLKSWTPLLVILLDYYHFLLCTKSNYRVSQKRLALGM